MRIHQIPHVMVSVSSAEPGITSAQRCAEGSTEEKPLLVASVPSLQSAAEPSSGTMHPTSSHVPPEYLPSPLAAQVSPWVYCPNPPAVGRQGGMMAIPGGGSSGVPSAMRRSQCDSGTKALISPITIQDISD